MVQVNRGAAVRPSLLSLSLLTLGAGRPSKFGSCVDPCQIDGYGQRWEVRGGSPEGARVFDVWVEEDDGWSDVS